MGLFGFGSSNVNAGYSAKHTARIVKDASGAAATNLNEIGDKGGVLLRKKAEAITVSLRKKDMSGVRAQVMLVLDHSGSMYGDYSRGVVQQIVERFLAFGLAVDVDGKIPVVAFDHKLHQTVEVDMSNFHDVVNEPIFKPHDMGSTDLTKALESVKKEAAKTEVPLFVGIVTDGEPDDRTSAERLVKELSQYPVFIKFLAVRKVNFLEKLDDMTDRLLDNVDTKEYSDISRVSDEDFAKDMVDEWDSWTKAALAAGVLTDV